MLQSLRMKSRLWTVHTEVRSLALTLPALSYNHYVLKRMVVILLCIVSLQSISGSMTNVILETDMTFDVDDVGALAVLHALTDRGEARILGVCYNEVHPHGVAAIKVINDWYGRGDIPIGQFEGELQQPDKSRYLTHVVNLADSTSPDDAINATEFYGTILEAQNNHAVTIISVGFLNNLADLLRSHPELVAQKIERLIVMGGLRNDNFNLVRHNLVNESQFVLENWPSPLVITDFGGTLKTGSSLARTPIQNPVREAYYRWFNGSFEGRSSWDQVAVLVGVRGDESEFHFIKGRTGRLRNGFEWQLDGNLRTYAQPIESSDYYLREIEQLMTIEPGGG